MNKTLLLPAVLALLVLSTALPALSTKITNLDPERVKVGWEGNLTINGTDLGEEGGPGQSFVAIEGLNVLVKSWTTSRIQVFVSKIATATPGKKRLVVHDKDAKFTETKWTVE